MSKPRVSVCVPMYNGGAYLEDCLAGIAVQSFPDFEVLIVDDCSTDDSVEVATRWAERDPRFKVHVNPSNLGLVGNWNRCVDLSSGEWIKFLFQDDLMVPDCLAEMIRAGEGSGGFVASSREILFEGDIESDLHEFYMEHRRRVRQIFGDTHRLSAEQYCVERVKNLDINIIGEPSVTLIKRSLFDAVGRFDPILIQMCDSEMWNRIASHVGVAFIPRDLVAFRVHRSSASGVNRGRHFRGTLIDGIIESSKLLYSPDLEGFRASLRHTGNLEPLRHALQMQINVAFYALRDSKVDRQKFRENRDRLKETLDRFGGFDRARHAFLLFRFKRLFNWVPAP